jgi:hypothetical protein
MVGKTVEEARERVCLIQAKIAGTVAKAPVAVMFQKSVRAHATTR